jgi:hypothetical protein
MARQIMRRAAPLLIAVVLALAGLAGLPPHAAAQDQPPLTVDVRVGYDGVYRIGDWFQVIVDVANSGPDIDGVIEWNFPGQLDEQVFHYQVELPQGARKRVAMNVFATGFARNGQVRLLDGDTVLSVQDVSLNSVDEGVFLIVVASSDPALLNSLESLQIDGFTSGTRVRHMPADELPEHIASMRGVNAIFLHDIDSAQLSPAQREALAAWVELGGQLVVSGGVGGASATAGLADLLPAQLSGTVAQGDITALARFAGASDPPPTPEAPLSQAQPRPEAEQLPPGADLLYRWRRGSGWATVSRFDFSSLRGWSGESGLWGAALDRSAMLTPGAGARLGRINLLDRGVLQLPSLDLPSTGTLMIFLLAYIMVIGPVNYLALRRMRRLEWAWVSVPLIVLGFAGGLYVVGNVLRGGQAQFNQVAVVQSSEGQTRGAATAFIGLFSPRRASYTIGFSADTLVSNAAGRASLSERFDTLVTDVNGARSVDVLADVASFNTFIAHAIVDLPLSIESSLISDTAGLRGEIHNTGASTLEDPILVRDGSFVRLDTLPPGESRSVDGPLQQNFPRSVNLSDAGVFDRQEMLNVLFDRDFIRLSNPGLPAGASDDDGVYLLAWVSQPTVVAEVNGLPADQNGLTLYVIRLRSAPDAAR